MFNLHLPFFGGAQKGPAIKPFVLIVFDGWGIAPPSAGNAIAQARTPNITQFLQNYPHTELIASGESVGLPANVVGNSEVGHLTIGAGRVIDESLVRINRSIENGEFYENDAFLKAANFVRQNNSTFHIAGMVSTGNVHSSLNHLSALIEFASRQKLAKVRLHLFMDGRDAAPQDGLNVVKEIESQISGTESIKVASISGRYYAMDRDARWERTQAVYDAMTLGKGNQATTATEAITAYYAQAITDEFIPPTLIVPTGGTPGVVSEKDALVLFNFRIDRPRQISMSFVLPDFERLKSYEWGFELDQGNVKSKVSTGPTFKREKILKDLFFVSMTEYQKQLPVSAVAYPNHVVDMPLAQVLSEKGLLQLHLAESEKERMVTYYFDGLKTDRFPGEEVQIVHSPRVSTYDKKPEMSAPEIVKQFKRALSHNKYHFIVANIANPDMVAHTGNLQATIRAVEVVDKCFGEIVNETLKYNGTLFLTADHGNAEELLTYNQSSFFFTSQSGSMNTEHSNNPVPFLIINQLYLGKGIQMPKGALSDVAPTILSLMGVQVPESMKGRNLFPDITKQQ